MESTTPLSSSTATMQADTKISNDLVVLKEKMDFLEEILNPSDMSAPKLSVKTDGAVLSIIGFLDACGPRMIELVTACTSGSVGVLSEEVFGDVLGCNDRLQKLLSDVDTRMMTETAASTTVAAAASSSSSPGADADVDGADDLLTDQFGDLLLGSDDDPFAESLETAGAKTTGEDDSFQKDIDDFFKEAAAPPVAPSTASPGEDLFDDFFAERTESSNFP